MPPGSTARLRLAADLLLVVITIFWGVSFSLIKQALDLTGPMNFLFLRFASAALFLAPVALARAGRLNRSTLTGGLLTGLNVVLVPLLSIFIFRRPPAVAAALGALAAFVGLVLLTGFDSAQNLPFNWGDGLTICCALSIAGHVLTLGRFAPGRDSALLGWLQLAVVATLSLAWTLIDGSFELALPGRVYGAAVFLALTATVLAFWGQSWAQRYTSPTRTAVIFTLEPVTAVVFAWFYLGEGLGLWGLAGGLLIIGGILLTEVKPAIWSRAGS